MPDMIYKKQVINNPTFHARTNLRATTFLAHPVNIFKKNKLSY